jgi:D-amino-acid dehydrogenase
MDWNRSMKTPRNAIVVGAGIVGLSVAWHLQELGVDVHVVERHDVASAASWGNAGWLTPGLATPLPDPHVLRYGLKGIFDSRSPLYVPPRFDPGLWKFLLRFATHCTPRTWDQSMRSYVPINNLALEAFDELTNAGVQGTTIAQPIYAAYHHASQAAPLLHEAETLNAMGLAWGVREVSGDEGRRLQPLLGPRIDHVVAIEDQRYFDPGAFVHALADAVRARGGRITTGARVTALETKTDGVRVVTPAETLRSDVVAVATGTWVGELARQLGVRTEVRAGRGYSFSVPTEVAATAPIYLPAQRIACTPYRGGLRVGGTMEFRPAQAALNPKRVANLVEAGQSMLTGVRWEEKTDVWVGPRPVSVDGLPLIGATQAPSVFLAGGHGMWGATLGPITGRLLAEQMVTGHRSDVLVPFNPLR